MRLDGIRDNNFNAINQSINQSINLSIILDLNRIAEFLVQPNLIFDLQVDDSFDDLQRRSADGISADAAASSTTKSTNTSSSEERRRRRGGGSVVDIPDVVVDYVKNVIAVIIIIAFVKRFDESGLIDEDEEGHE